VLSLSVQVGALALGVLASPLPAVAVLVTLLTKRAKPNSLVMLVSWIVGVVLALGISVMLAGRIHLPSAGVDLPFEGLFTALLGIGVFIMGVHSRRGRFRSEDPQDPPAWVNSVDNLSPIGGAIVVFSNATTSPKNLALAISAGALLTKPGVPVVDSIVAATVYIIIASLTLVGPVALYVFGGDKSTAILQRWKDKVTENAAAVMEISLFGIGLAMTAKGLFNLLT